MNQRTEPASAKKLAAVDTAEFFRACAAEADMEEFRALLDRGGGQAPCPGDEVPATFTPPGK